MAVIVGSEVGDILVLILLVLLIVFLARRM
jgi:hypothetical protein